ncbi:MAG: hypothetical protein AB4372_38345 [Xenococcus sp. (in: cyanobacteria)]
MAKSKSFSKKYTATITCDHGLWITFKTWAKKQNSSASAEIEKFMLQAVTNNSYVADLYEQKENLESLLRMLVDQELNSRGYFDKNTDDTESTDGIGNTDASKNTDNTEDTYISKERQDKCSDLLYTDRELKDLEGLSQHQSTITRWRRGTGKIPERISQNYEVVGSKWKYVGLLTDDN